MPSPAALRPGPFARLAAAAGRLPDGAWLGLGALALVARRPDAFHRPQFWAEDGMFYVDALVRGGDALTLPYAGYLHLAPRLAAHAAAAVDPLFAPALTTAVAFAGALSVLARLLSERLPLPHRPWLAAAFVLVPEARELLFNITNLQWLLALALTLLLVSDDARRPRQHVADLTLAALAGTSGPFSLLLGPLFLVRALRRRSGASLALAAVVLAAAAWQGWTLSRAPVVASGEVALLQLSAVPAILGLRLSSLVLPPEWLGLAGPGNRGLIGAGTLGIALAGFCALRPGPARAARLQLGLAWVLLVAAALFRLRHSPDLLFQVQNGPRYFFLPQVLLLLLVITGWPAHSVWPWPRRGLASAFALMALSRFSLEPFVDLHWPAQAAEIRAGRAVTFPVNPPGMTIDCPAIAPAGPKK